ncbi:MAG: dimethylargininase [Acidimicrobiia bacterium]
MRLALMRAVPDSFTEALVRGERPPIDIDEARRQHDTYRAVLEDAGYRVKMLPTDESHPDCPFVEDAAVVLGGTAVLTRPGAPSRRGEVLPVAEALESHLSVVAIEEPGTLDGGDVMRMGDAVFVGRSERSNEDGISQLKAIAHGQGLTATPVDLAGVLHLKSAVLPLDHETVLMAPRHVDESAFNAYNVIPKARGEEHLASALPLADGRVMVTVTAPRTITELESAGYHVIAVDTSQFQAADGGLTCLSILLD